MSGKYVDDANDGNKQTKEELHNDHTTTTTITPQQEN